MKPALKVSSKRKTEKRKTVKSETKIIKMTDEGEGDRVKTKPTQNFSSDGEQRSKKYRHG